MSDEVLFTTICVFFGLYHEVWIYGTISRIATIMFQRACSLLEVAF